MPYIWTAQQDAKLCEWCASHEGMVITNPSKLSGENRGYNEWPDKRQPVPGIPAHKDCRCYWRNFDPLQSDWRFPVLGPSGNPSYYARIRFEGQTRNRKRPHHIDFIKTFVNTIGPASIYHINVTGDFTVVNDGHWPFLSVHTRSNDLIGPHADYRNFWLKIEIKWKADYIDDIRTKTVVRRCSYRDDKGQNKLWGRHVVQLTDVIGRFEGELSIKTTLFEDEELTKEVGNGIDIFGRGFQKEWEETAEPGPQYQNPPSSNQIINFVSDNIRFLTTHINTNAFDNLITNVAAEPIPSLQVPEDHPMEYIILKKYTYDLEGEWTKNFKYKLRWETHGNRLWYIYKKTEITIPKDTIAYLGGEGESETKVYYECINPISSSPIIDHTWMPGTNPEFHVMQYSVPIVTSGSLAEIDLNGITTGDVLQVKPIVSGVFQPKSNTIQAGKLGHPLDWYNW